MGLFDKIFGKKETVKVEFLNSMDGSLIGVSDMPVDQLPETFEISTTMNLEGSEWSVQEAIPVHSDDFRKSGNLKLKLSKIEYRDPKEFLFTIPTISNELPEAVDSTPFEGAEYSIMEDDWRQYEFLNKSANTRIEAECAKIDELKQNSSKVVSEDFPAFTSCHLRSEIGSPNLELSLAELKEVLRIEEVGSLKFHGNTAYLKNGFSLKGENSTYFGTVQEGIVRELCIGKLTDGTSKDIRLILDRFDILFVNWYHSEVISKDD